MKVIAQEGDWVLEKRWKTAWIDHDCEENRARTAWLKKDSNTLPPAGNNCYFGNLGGPICMHCRKRAPSNIEAMYHTANMCRETQ